MNPKNNWYVGHFSNGLSDKVYLVFVRELPGKLWQVVAKWGRRSATRMSVQVKGEYKNRDAAQVLMDNLFQEKLNKGYRDIAASDYTGPVTFASVRRHLETNDEDENTRLVEKKVSDQSMNLMRLTVRCINNTGMEDRLALGGEYKALPTSDANLIQVTCLDGSTKNCLRERFEELT